jgi:hypothetical protein
MALRVFSYGGGVQSTAALVLASQDKIDFKTFIFSNVGADSEHPATLRYVAEVSKPFAAKHGIKMVELNHIRRDGQEGTLYRKLTRPGSRSTGIPIYFESTGAHGMRSCTSEFKIRRIAVWQRRHGATREDPAVTGLGISLDEYQRMRTDSGIDTQILEYPLIDLRLTRQDCMNIISAAGLPVPPKSSCWFCPFHSINTWRKLKEEEPELFDKAIELEQILSDRAISGGRGKVFLTRRMQPLAQVTAGTQHALDFEEDACESGFCLV